MAKKKPTGDLRKYTNRLEALRSDRSSMMPYWGELADYHLAHRGRFLTGNDNKSEPKRNTKQFNNTSRLALRTLASGMMSGLTSPARPWFTLGPSDPDMAEFSAVKEWLDKVEKLLYRIFAKSNTYNSLHTLYTELGCFATACMTVYEDFDNVIHTQAETVGSYMLGVGRNRRVDTRYREFTLTVGQVVKDYGIENCSNQVQHLWRTGATEQPVEIVHIIEPNDDRDMMSPLSRDMAFRSVTFEKNARGDQVLRQAGFRTFPTLAPRWDVVGEEVYGLESPGMLALGDTKALQLGERRMYQAVDKLADPPLQGDSNLRSTLGDSSPRPGQVYWLSSGATQGLQPIYGPNYQPRVDILMNLQNKVEARINETFYKDLFLMLAMSDRRQMTAREVAEKHEEKLIMLGPVLERLQAELLDPLIDRTFNIVLSSGIMPPPPRELQGTELSVEYISLLAQAQRMVGISALERTAAFTAQLSERWPEARHKIDALQMVDEYANSMGTAPSVIRPDDEVDEILEAEQQAAAEAQRMAQAQQQANMARGGGVEPMPETNMAQALSDAGLV